MGRGPLGQMRRFHDRERKLIRILRQAEIDGWPGVVDNEAEVLAAIAELIASQRKHITLEDEVVFPIAEQKLDAAEHASLAHEIEQFEREQCDTTVLGDLIARVRALCERHSLDDSAT